MKHSLRRWAAAGMAAAATMAMTVGPAYAAADEGPYLFDAAGSGQAVSVVVGLPQALADGLAPVVEFVPPAVGAERASEALTRSGETDPAAVARASEALAREIDSMELLAAHLWAQLEGAGIDPSGAMRRSSR